MGEAQHQGVRAAVDRHDARTAVLGGLFDDAAMFPPATRPLEDALASHRGHQSGERRWLLRRFLVRASDVAQLAAALAPDDVLELGVVLDLATGGTFADAVAADADAAAQVGGDRRVQLSGVEVALAGGDPDEEVAAVLAGTLLAGLPDHVTIAVEVPVAGRPAGEVVAGLTAVADARAAGGPGAVLAAKLRCGGSDAAGVPADVELAGFLLACARLDLPFKATAGLHHPTRTTSWVHGGLEHGFLNLVAATAASRRGVGLEELTARLALPPAEVALSAAALVAGPDTIDGPSLLDLRRRTLLGIGCCDILDPITDLAGMGAVLPTGGLR